MQDNHFEKYEQYKDEVLSLLAESAEFYTNQGMNKQADMIQDNIDVIKSGEFEVVVVGEFSTGKSTFLNALMGEKYLPSYTKETTATINYLRHSSESEFPGIAYFYDGHTEQLPSLDYDVVARYVSTKNKEMKVEENIKHLDLFIDSPFLENNVTLIDSPGLNGMKYGLSDITDVQIRRSHAVIFLFSAEQAGKRSEFEYLKKVKDQVDTVFLVLNKIDCVKKSENETVEDKIQDLIESYKSVFPDDTLLPEIIPIAAYPALVARSKLNLDYPQNHFNVTEEEKAELEKSSLMIAFEEKLLHFLANSEKTITQIKEPIQRLSTTLDDSISRYDREIASIENQNDGIKIQEQISVLKATLSELESQLDNQRGEIRRSIKNIERETIEALDKELETVRRQGRASIDELDNIDTLGDYFDLLNKLLGRKLDGVVSKLDQTFRDNFFDAVQNQYTGIISSLEEKVEGIETGIITFDAQINVTAKTINSGLENFNAMKKELEQKMKDLETQQKDLSVKADQLIEITYQYDELKARLERLHQSESELTKSFCPPEVVTVIKPGEREIDRKGLFHGLRDFILGKKTESYTYEDRDDSERKEYISNYNAEKRRLNDKQDELERKLDGMAGTEKKLDRTMSEREAVQAELVELRTQETEMKVLFNKELNEKYEKEIERIKKKALIDMDNYLDEIRPQIQKVLKDNRTLYIGVLQDLIEQSVWVQINQKREECDNLIKLKDEANDNKEQALGKITELKDSAIVLKNKADELIKGISAIDIDRVNYQFI